MFQPPLANRTPASPFPTLTSRLRDATVTVRDDRELLAGRVTGQEYRTYLLRMYGFLANVERALKSCRPLAGVIADAPLRNHKSALIAHDLVALGVERVELIAAPRMRFPGALALPEALGWTYAVESIALGGKQLQRHLARQLPAEVSRASAYLGCYGNEAPERWRELGEAIDGFEHVVRDGDRVVGAAHDGFAQLRAWIRPALQAHPSKILA